MDADRRVIRRRVSCPAGGLLSRIQHPVNRRALASGCDAWRFIYKSGNINHSDMYKNTKS